MIKKVCPVSKKKHVMSEELGYSNVTVVYYLRLSYDYSWLDIGLDLFTT